MAARVRTAAIWVPPLQERDSACERIKKPQGEESILGEETTEQRPLPGGEGQRHRSPRTERVLEWLFISQEQLKTTKSWIKCGKLIIWNGIGKNKSSWEVLQKAISVLHLEDYVFLVQIMFLQDKSFIHVSHMKRV
uniref:Zinc finger protein 268 n=2 Tax=Sus scrofa TaxID=9823 RepID=A0A4X1SRW2_PIG